MHAPSASIVAQACEARCCTRCRAARSSSASRSSSSCCAVGVAARQRAAVPQRRRHASPAWRSRSAPATSSFQLIVLAKRRLLWRVRRKLILSYIFIGFVPALLLVAFFAAVRLPAVLQLQLVPGAEPAARAERQARFLAQSTALEIQRAGGRDVAGIIARRQANAAERVSRTSRSPSCRSTARATNRRSSNSGKAAAGLSGQSAATSGRGRTSTPPRAVPAWIDCAGLLRRAGLLAPAAVGGDDADTHLLVRGGRVSRFAATRLRGRRRPARSTIAIRQQLRRETGVELQERRRAAPTKPDRTRKPLRGRGRRRRRAAARSSPTAAS